MIALVMSVAIAAAVQEVPYAPYEKCLREHAARYQATGVSRQEFQAAMRSICASTSTALLNALMSSIREQGGSSEQAGQFTMQEIRRVQAEVLADYPG